MQSIRRSLSFAGLSVLAMALTFAACTDDNQSPMGPTTPPVVAPPSRTVATIECRATVKTGEVSCGSPVSRNPGISGAMLGDQNVNVKLISSDRQVVADTFAFDVQIANVIRQPTDGRQQMLGTTDGTTPSPITVFFFQGPTVLGETGGEVNVIADTEVNLTGGGMQPAYIYDADEDVVLAPGDTTLPRRWKLTFTPQVEQFSFVLLVEAPVTLTAGWVDITSAGVGLANLQLPTSTTRDLDATPRFYSGYEIDPVELVEWSSTADSVATVDASGGPLPVRRGRGGGQRDPDGRSGQLRRDQERDAADPRVGGAAGLRERPGQRRAHQGRGRLDGGEGLRHHRGRRQLHLPPQARLQRHRLLHLHRPRRRQHRDRDRHAGGGGQRLLVRA
jgi:hypothetical protein